MKRLLGALFFVGALASPAYAGSLAVTPGSGATVGTGTDGTNQIPATILCGATSSATLYATCVNQAIVNGSGQLLTLDSQSGTWNITNVSGTVSLPTGAATATNQTNVIGSATGGTAAADSLLGGGIYNSSAPTLTNGQQAALQFTSAGSLHTTVDNTNANGQATMANSAPVVIASNQSAVPASQSGTWNIGSITTLPSLVAGSAIVGKVGIDQTTVGTTNGVSIAQIGANTVASGSGAVGTGSLRVAVGTDSTTIAGSSPTTVLVEQPQAGTAGGASPTGNIVANNTTAVVVKASAGTLYSVQLAGLGSAPAYLKIYNATSATCGSGTPVARYMIPANATAANGAGSNIDLGPVGVAYSTGITYCVTTGIADTDTTAPAASTFLVNLVWK